MISLDMAALRKLSTALRPIASAAVLIGAAATFPAYAQTAAGNPLGGDGLAESYKANAGKPIDIEADALEVDDQKKIAVFTGNVSATQGDFNLRAKEIQVTYASKPKGAETASADGGAAGLPGGANDITQIDAKGKVLVTTKGNQTATSDWAIFDVPKQLVTIGGDVVLSRGGDTIKGDKLVIDLKTGKSRFDTGGALASGVEKGKQRIQAIFTPKSREKDKDKEKDAEKKN
jgi:lipopolysaccharide export system protein LptA